MHSTGELRGEGDEEVKGESSSGTIFYFSASREVSFYSSPGAAAGDHLAINITTSMWMRRCSGSVLVCLCQPASLHFSFIGFLFFQFHRKRNKNATLLSRDPVSKILPPTNQHVVLSQGYCTALHSCVWTEASLCLFLG